MADEEQLKILKRGVDAWNTWRMENSGKDIDLSGADLNKTKLISANLSGADLNDGVFLEVPRNCLVLFKEDKIPKA